MPHPRLTVSRAGRIVRPSTQCRTALPPHRAQRNGGAIESVLPGPAAIARFHTQPPRTTRSIAPVCARLAKELGLPVYESVEDLARGVKP